MKKKLWILKLPLVCVLFFVQPYQILFAQKVQNTGANTIESSKALIDVNAVVWAAPAEQKIRPENGIESRNIIWDQHGKEINVFGAGNEHVPFQVIITVPVPGGRKAKAPGGFFITSSDFTAGKDQVIPKEKIKFYLEHYIMLTGKSSPIGNTGYWPDALAPIQVPFNMAAQYDIVKNRPIWVDLFIPYQTPSGTYRGTITVTQNEQAIDILNVKIRVYGFSLPEKRHLITYMNASRGELARFYHKPFTSAEIDKLTQSYYDFLYEHRLEPWFNDQLQPEISLNGEEVKVEFDGARYKYFMNNLNTNRVLFNAYPSSLGEKIGKEKFTAGFNKIIKSYLSQVAAYFKSNGWNDNLVFNSPIDEPNSKQDYEETRKWADLVHDAAPGVPFLATESPVTDNPEWGVLNGKVDNFSIHGNALNKEEVKKAIRKEQEKGGEITWYISCDQHYPQPNYFIDAPALDLVMVPWITARYHMQGFLYWAVNFWSQTPNPWLNANTYISGFECSGGYILNGEGTILYPGDFVNRYIGQPDISGPVSSMRFELLREGIEDYEYIWLLRNSGDSNFAEEKIKGLVIDVSTFSRNLEDLYSTRKAMAIRIEGRVK